MQAAVPLNASIIRRPAFPTREAQAGRDTAHDAAVDTTRIGATACSSGGGSDDMIHHASRTVDWLSSSGSIPSIDAVSRIAQVLRRSGSVSAGWHSGFVPLFTLCALLLDANVSWTFGPLRHVRASPTFHRWHHTTEADAIDQSFAVFLPFSDLAFGTAPDRRLQRFGSSKDVPGGSPARSS